MKTGFVFTNYNNSHYTRQVVDSISLNGNWNDCKVVIVDNKSEPIDIQLLKQIIEDYPSVKLILNEDNIGYFKGLNVGIKYLRDNFPELDVIVIGNNDLVFPADFIDKLKINKANLDKYAVISPDLITLDGVHQNPHVIEKISKIREFIYDIYYTNYYFSLTISYMAKLTKRFTDRKRKDEKQSEIAQTIYMGYGACYILTAMFFKNFDLLWAPTFLMGEEFFLSKQLEEKNLKIYYEPAIAVNHHDHATVNKIPGKKFWKISSDSHKIYRRHKRYSWLK